MCSKVEGCKKRARYVLLIIYNARRITCYFIAPLITLSRVPLSTSLHPFKRAVPLCTFDDFVVQFALSTLDENASLHESWILFAPGSWLDGFTWHTPRSSSSTSTQEHKFTTYFACNHRTFTSVHTTTWLLSLEMINDSTKGSHFIHWVRSRWFVNPRNDQMTSQKNANNWVDLLFCSLRVCSLDLSLQLDSFLIFVFYSLFVLIWLTL